MNVDQASPVKSPWYRSFAVGLPDLLRAFTAAFLMLLAAPLATAGTYKLSIDSEVGKRLSNLPENSWIRLNLNEFQDVWTPSDQRPKPPTAPSVGGPWAVLDAWSSMAWDSNRGNLIFWGGGHANYPGNEIYLWVANDQRWARASLPSEVAQPDPLWPSRYESVDGLFAAPISAHTYDSSEFLPLSDRFVTFGGAAFNTGSPFQHRDGRRTGPYFWDPARASVNAVGGTAGSQVKPDLYPSVSAGLMWQNRDNLNPAFPDDPKPGIGGTFWIDGTTAYAEEQGRDVLYIAVGSQLFRYTVHDRSDPLRDTYEMLGVHRLSPFSGQGAGAFDPARRIYLRTANSTFTYWTLDNPGWSNENIIFTPAVTSGSFPFSDLRNHGLDFDPIRRSFLLWGGQRDVWRLSAPTSLSTGTWQLTPLSPTSVAAPDLANAVGTKTGILGKWKYVPALDVFLGVIDRNKGEIWAYKPTNWQPSVTVALPFVVAPAAGSVHAVGASVPIVVDSVDKSVSYVAAYVNGVMVGTANAVPHSFAWTALSVGAYSISVRTVGTDGIERVSPPVSVSIVDLSNVAPTVALTSPAAGQSFAQGSVIALTAAASDMDGTISRVEFYAGGVKLGEDLSAPYGISWSGAAVGSHTLTAVAYDDKGASTTSTGVSISVTASVPNVAPTVALTSPAAGQSFTQGSAIALSAAASDTDGTISRVEFYAGGVKLGEALSAPFGYSWSGAAVGSYTLTAVAYDNAGASGTSAAVSVSVVAGSPGNEQTLTLQDGLNGYTGAADAYLYEFHNTVNFGAAQFLQDKATGTRFRSLVKFAIFQSEGGPVPNGATITSATLSLYKYSYYDTKYQLRPLLTNWVEGEVTWNQSRQGAPWAGPGATAVGSDVAASPDGTGDALWNPGWLVLDVTGGVQAMVAGRPNHGWVLDAVSGNGNLKNFYSSEYTADMARRPVLTIRYR